MGTSRPPRSSEESFNIALNEMRGIDKMLWNGDKCFIEEIEESIRIIKQRLDCMIEQFKKEARK